LLYLDGGLEADVTINDPVTLQTNDESLKIGVNGELDDNFIGNIDELTIYNRILDISEIQEIVNAGSDGKKIPTLTLQKIIINDDQNPTLSENDFTYRINDAVLISIPIVDTHDDAEEDVSSDVVDPHSSDLELAEDGSDEQEIGLRFQNVAIPQGATILSANIQFTTDDDDIDLDTSLIIHGQDIDSASTFTSVDFDISSRAKTTTNIPWLPPGWNTFGESGPAQLTPDISSVLQEIISRPGWSSGNSLAIIITGTGERTAEVYEDDPNTAAVLSITFDTGGSSQTVSRQILQPSDDAEEDISDGVIELSSSDMELGEEQSDNGPQEVGLRFQNILIPQGATIQSASIQFTTDDDDTDFDTSLIIHGQDIDSALIFTEDDNNISSRAKTTTNVPWLPPEWNTFGESGPAQLTPDISSVLQEIISRPGWSSGNSLAIIITGTGERTAEVYDDDPNKAAVLLVVYETATQTVLAQVSQGSDDAEEPPVDLDSSDLELVDEDSSNQQVGLRFQNILIPQGATIQSASIQFTTDDDDTDSGATSLVLHGQDDDNASTFTVTPGDISSRTKTAANVPWSPPAWNNVGESGPAQLTPDISSVLQEIVSRPGWSSGNSLAIIITGTGERTAEVYEDDPNTAAVLSITFDTGGSSQTISRQILQPSDDAEEPPVDLDGSLDDYDFIKKIIVWF